MAIAPSAYQQERNVIHATRPAHREREEGHATRTYRKQASGKGGIQSSQKNSSVIDYSIDYCRQIMVLWNSSNRTAGTNWIVTWTISHFFLAFQTSHHGIV